MKGQDLNLSLCTKSEVIALKKVDFIRSFTLDGGFSHQGFSRYLNSDTATWKRFKMNVVTCCLFTKCFRLLDKEKLCFSHTGHPKKLVNQ